MSDPERNRLSARLNRYARVGAGMGGVAARMAGNRLFGAEGSPQALANALGGLKGPLMKVAQLLATIPEALPPEYAAELMKLQSEAPPMGPVFVRRRMAAELGTDWASKFSSFDKEPAAAASLGQVHRARSLDGSPLACKLQYPEMQSAVEADLHQLEAVFALHRRFDPAIDTREIAKEIGARLREELDYERESRHMRLYASIFRNDPQIRIPAPQPHLSTRRLLTMDWLDGRHILSYKDSSLDIRNRLATAMFKAWWLPFSHYGVIHGDPHLGNYSVFDDDGEPTGINLLDYGCIRIFPPSFVQGVIDLYRALRADDLPRAAEAYRTWGFKNLPDDLVEVLNIWARFIYGPLLEDRVRAIADGISPAEYGRRQAFEVHKALKERGPVTAPQEFVFMDRAAIGLGAVFLHLRAELNFHRLFEETIVDFDLARLAERQRIALNDVGLESATIR